MARKSEVERDKKRKVPPPTKKKTPPKHVNGKGPILPRSVVLEELYGDDEDEEEDDVEVATAASEASESVVDEDSPSTSLQGLNRDIFLDLGQKREEEGRPIYYLIYDNGGQLARKDHPYSWHELQQEFGRGNYKVQARDAAKNNVVGWDQRRVLDPPGFKGRSRSEDLSVPHYAPAPQAAAPAAPATDPIALVNTVLAAVRGQENSGAKAEAASMSAFANMMNNMNTQFQAIMAGQSAQNMKMFEMMQTQIKEIASASKEKPMSPLELMKMLRESEEGGMKKYLEILKMVKSETEDKESVAEVIERLLAAKKDDGKEDKGVLASALEMLAPMIAAAAAKGGAAPAQASPIQPALAAPQSPVIEEPVRQVKATVQRPPVQQPARPTVAQPAPSSLNAGGIVKPKIIEILRPSVESWLTQRLPAEAAAPRAEALLKQNGITRQAYASSIKLDDLVQLRRSYENLPAAFAPMVDAWLKDFHEALSAPGPQ